MARIPNLFKEEAFHYSQLMGNPLASLLNAAEYRNFLNAYFLKVRLNGRVVEDNGEENKLAKQWVCDQIRELKKHKQFSKLQNWHLAFADKAFNSQNVTREQIKAREGWLRMGATLRETEASALAQINFLLTHHFDITLALETVAQLIANSHHLSFKAQLIYSLEKAILNKNFAITYAQRDELTRLAQSIFKDDYSAPKLKDYYPSLSDLMSDFRALVFWHTFPKFQSKIAQIQMTNSPEFLRATISRGMGALANADDPSDMQDYRIRQMLENFLSRNPNQQNFYIDTLPLLASALQRQDFQEVALLNAAGVDMHCLKLGNGKSPLETAIEFGVLKCGTTNNEQLESNCIAILTTLLDAGAYLDQSLESDVRTPLFLIMEGNDSSRTLRIKIAEKLISAGCDVNAGNEYSEKLDGSDLLSRSIKALVPAVTKLLLENGADPNGVNCVTGFSPLHTAAQKDENIWSAFLLVKYGADCSALALCADGSWKTPVQVAHHQDAHEMAEELLIAPKIQAEAQHKAALRQKQEEQQREALKEEEKELVRKRAASSAEPQQPLVLQLGASDNTSDKLIDSTSTPSTPPGPLRYVVFSILTFGIYPLLMIVFGTFVAIHKLRRSSQSIIEMRERGDDTQSLLSESTDHSSEIETSAPEADTSHIFFSFCREWEEVFRDGADAVMGPCIAKPIRTPTYH